MPIPGRNNLALAMRLIRPQTVTYYRFAGRVTDAAGVMRGIFDPPRPITGGSVQPVPAARYERLGLDHARRYVQWWAPANLLTVARERGPDEFEWNGRRYQVTQDDNWHAQDGWTVVTAVELSGLPQGGYVGRPLRVTVDQSPRAAAGGGQLRTAAT